MDPEVDDDLVELVGSRNAGHFDHRSHSHLKPLELINRDFLGRIVHVLQSSPYRDLRLGNYLFKWGPTITVDNRELSRYFLPINIKSSRVIFEKSCRLLTK